MKFFLLKMKVNGIKSINLEIELNYYNKTLPKKLDTTRSHVKAIYGANGAGKTGIIYAVEIYKNLMIQQDYITLSNSNNSLVNLINQNRKKLEIEMTFAVLDDQNVVKCVLTHFIVLENKDGEFVLSEEKLIDLKQSKKGESNAEILFSVKNGEIVRLSNKCKNSDKIKNATMNLLQKQSLVNIMFKSYLKDHLKDKAINIENDFDIAIAFTNLFSFNITVFLQNSDTNYVNFDLLYEQVNALGDFKTKIKNDEVFYTLLTQNKIISNNIEKVPKDKFEDYKKTINNLCSFIKVFKNDLENIEIKKEENGDYFECDNIMVYNDGRRINKKYESTGIKKIIELYSALCDLERGKIVFIDEFDANIHDVLLTKLIEYIVQFAKGQFVFTTHNLGPMDVLQKYKHSIDFLSSDSKLVPWVKNGHYSAASQYSKGFIEYSPFNIEPFSFLGVFGE